jgi:hypothetical protein
MVDPNGYDLPKVTQSAGRVNVLGSVTSVLYGESGPFNGSTASFRPIPIAQF